MENRYISNLKQKLNTLRTCYRLAQLDSYKAPKEYEQILKDRLVDLEIKMKKAREELYAYIQEKGSDNTN